jgi:hypothetical protein
MKSLQEHTKSLEKMLTKKDLLMQKKEESLKHIRELGTLPSEAFDKYTNTPPKRVSFGKRTNFITQCKMIPILFKASFKTSRN